MFCGSIDFEFLFIQYAIAVTPSQKRSGKDILALFGEATQSERVSSNFQSGSDGKPLSSFFGAASSSNKKEKKEKEKGGKGKEKKGGKPSRETDNKEQVRQIFSSTSRPSISLVGILFIDMLMFIDFLLWT